MDTTIHHKKSINAWIIYVVIAVVVLIAILTAVYFYHKYQKAQQMLATNPSAQQVKADALIKKIGELLVLPSGEVPTIATVSDSTKLAGQPFFAQSKNGDVVLIYAVSKKAILYDPSTNKIVNVGPISLNATTTITPTVAPTEQKYQLLLTPTPITTTIAPQK